METTQNVDKLKNTEKKQSTLNIAGFVPDFPKP